MHGPAATFDLSVIAPAHDEADNLGPLMVEITAALDPLGLAYEVIVVDDASEDDTAAVLGALAREHDRLRPLRIQSATGSAAGQSAAFRAGFRIARGRLIATLDADLQNDPSDLPILLARLEETGVDLVQGDRTACRHDTWGRRASSVVGRVARRVVVDDRTRDTGCSLRVMRRPLALALPLDHRGLHRFIPALAEHLGYTVLEMPVRHRARIAGRTKYGVLDRAWPGLVDCFAVRWMKQRRRPVTTEVIVPETTRRRAAETVRQ